MKPFDNLAVAVAPSKHARAKHDDGANNRPLVFSGQQPKTCLLARVKHSPPEAKPWAGLFLHSSNSPEPAQRSAGPRHAGWFISLPQTFLYPLRDRRLSAQARAVRGHTMPKPRSTHWSCANSGEWLVKRSSRTQANAVGCPLVRPAASGYFAGVPIYVGELCTVIKPNHE